MTYTRPLHQHDQDCIPDLTGECLVCGTVAGEPCPDCAGVRFHLVGCPGSAAPELGPMLPTAVALERGIGHRDRLYRLIRAAWRPEEAR